MTAALALIATAFLLLICSVVRPVAQKTWVSRVFAVAGYGCSAYAMSILAGMVIR